MGTPRLLSRRGRADRFGGVSLQPPSRVRKTHNRTFQAISVRGKAVTPSRLGRKTLSRWNRTRSPCSVAGLQVSPNGWLALGAPSAAEAIAEVARISSPLRCNRLLESFRAAQPRCRISVMQTGAVFSAATGCELPASFKKTHCRLCRARLQDFCRVSTSTQIDARRVPLSQAESRFARRAFRRVGPLEWGFSRGRVGNTAQNSRFAMIVVDNGLIDQIRVPGKRGRPEQSLLRIFGSAPSSFQLFGGEQ